MFDALLAPFSTTHWQRRLTYLENDYYDRLTRDSLRSQLGSDLLDDPRPGFVAQLRQASRSRNALRQTFDRFAVIHPPSGKHVWTAQCFAAFVSTRLNDGHSDTALPTAALLWRCFCYNAMYPFVDSPSIHTEHHVDLDGWLQAIALLVTAGTMRFVRNGAMLSLYGSPPDFDSRRRCGWRRFASLSPPPVDRDASLHSSEHASWLPPEPLDEIADVAATQLPFSMCVELSPLENIRYRVQKLAGKSNMTPQSTGVSVVPYQDMLALLAAVMRVDTSDPRDQPSDHSPWLTISPASNSASEVAMAKAILSICGIYEPTPVSFTDYLAFSEKFDYSSHHCAFSFDLEITTLWCALFFGKDSNLPPSSQGSKLQFTSRSSDLPSPPSPPNRPPTFILQALDFLYPFERSVYERRFRQQSTLTCSTHHDPDSKLSRAAVLQALTWPYGPKLVLIYGTTITTTATSPSVQSAHQHAQNAPSSQTAIFAILTSSPLWCTYTTGKIDDFQIGDSHLLLELAPRPRVLWHPVAQTKYLDLVTGADNHVDDDYPPSQLNFGTPPSSGLALDFHAALALLSSSPSPPHPQPYTEIPPGPRRDSEDAPAAAAAAAAVPGAWESSLRIAAIEVYTGPGGVLRGLAVERPAAVPPSLSSSEVESHS